MTAVVSVQDAVVRFTHVNALNGVSIRVPKGSCFGVVGESGSGKTTLMRAILGLQRLNAGSIVLSNVAQGSSARERARIVQAIFQDPASSLSPRRSVAQALDEVAELLGEARESLGKRTHAMLRRLGLSPALIDKYPHQLSGGQARRVALLRALLVKPQVLIADEPTAGLDVSVQGDLLNLLQDLRRDTELTLIVVSHNLAVVRLIADEAAVMHRGLVVEQGRADELFDAPRSDYMRQLLAAWPRLKPH